MKRIYHLFSRGGIKHLTDEMEIAYSSALNISLAEFINQMHKDQGINLCTVVKIPVRGVIENMTIMEYTIPDIINVPDMMLGDFIRFEEDLIALEIKDRNLDDGMSFNEFLIIYRTTKFWDNRTHIIHINGQVAVRKIRQAQNNNVLLIASNGKETRVPEAELQLIGVLVSRHRIHMYD